jgi:hypothetical protein
MKVGISCNAGTDSSLPLNCVKMIGIQFADRIWKKIDFINRLISES